MNLSLFTRGLAALGLLLLLAAVSCGGGGGTTTPVGGGVIDNGDNNVPPIDIDGPTQYPGQQPGQIPDPTDPDGDPVVPDRGPFDFGNNVFAIPADSNRVGRVVANNFSPGQKVAFVVVNMNPAYLDATDGDGGVFPTLPESAYSFSADLFFKGSSASGDRIQTQSFAEIAQNTVEAIGGPGRYSGMVYDGQKKPVESIYQREAIANGTVPYSVEPVRSVSAIQKGELRWFENVPPRDLAPPTIIPGPDDPTKDVSELTYPPQYNSQSGRLVAIGAHCLVFLSTEINDGHPDNVTFTQSRLNRLANEFDSKIYAIATSSFGDVKNYEDNSIWRDLNRNLVLTGDDFDSEGNLTVELDGEIDTDLQAEKRIIIFIMNGEAGGFFAFGPGDPDNDIRATSVGNCLYIGSDNFPANDAVWDAAFSVMAHEFQHKLYNDHNLPRRQTSYMWFNEGLSQLSIHLCGYTVNSGKIIPWAIDGQLTDYLNNTAGSAVPMDANPFFSNQSQYGNGFLFFLYLYEHYDPGVGKRIYQASAAGETDFIKLIEAGAQLTVTALGPDKLAGTPDDNTFLSGGDGVVGTGDDKTQVVHDTFEQIYAKFAIANFVDGIYANNEEFFDSRFFYNTIDLRGTVNLVSGQIVLPGVQTGVFPTNGAYPVNVNDRPVIPWGCDYLVFGGGDGRDLKIDFVSDSLFRVFMLPVSFDTATNSVNITQGVTMSY
ncbi:hypothetical protein IT575_05295 [bacterium]|nr:hypothetical protein [bacterium]